ncbi:aminotransferase [Pyramidobacter sp.]|uniref:aminotransferase n=1 Tax=Pyramidobacter sp. TaxID=1943581 RepID=UPI003318CC6F
MKIRPFAVEEWMNAYETGAAYNIAETCVSSISVDELFALTGANKREFLDAFCARRLAYGDIQGAPAFKRGVCKLYRTIAPEDLVTTHGAAGANHHLFYSLIEPGDRVVTVMPTYQQLYSIPESYGADVKIMRLKPENRYLPDLEELKGLVVPGTKMICLNNPNNPSGALMNTELLEQIAAIARSVGAWIVCDEVYRHLTQTDEWQESIADLYEKGISVSSMSKTFSLAGLRLGWIATRDRSALKACLSHRNYNLISCGMFDEALAAVALAHGDALLARNRAIVRANLAILDEWVAGQPHVRYVKPVAGTTALLHYDLDMPSYEFCEKMYRQTGAFVTPGDCFAEPYSLRIGYACDAATLKAGLAAVSEFLASYEESHSTPRS